MRALAFALLFSAVPVRADLQFQADSLSVANSQSSLQPATSTTDVSAPNLSIVVQSPSPGLRLGTVPQALSTETVALWRFDENGGGTAFDQSANKLDLSLSCVGSSCSAAAFSGGQFSNALVLASTTQFAALNAPAFNLTQQLSWEAWVNVSTSDGSAFQAILQHGTQYGLFLNAAGRFVCSTNDGSAAVTGNTVPPAGTWHHVACVFGPGAGGKRLFVDGRLDAAPVTPSGSLTSNAQSLSVGLNPDAPLDGFLGSVDDARVVARALGDLEVLADFIGESVRLSTTGASGAFTTVLSPSSIAVTGTDVLQPATVLASPRFAFQSCSTQNVVQFLAQDTFGQTHFSPPFQIFVATFTPRVPTMNAPSPLGLGVSSITFSWSSSACDSSYQVFLTSASPAVQLPSIGITSATVSGLSPNTLVAMAVSAVDAAGASTRSASASAFTRAAPPANTRLLSVSSTSISLAWDANGNPDYTPYRISFGPVGGATSTVVVASTQAVFSGLAPQTAFFAHVQASNAVAISTLTAFDLELATTTLPAFQSVVVATPSIAIAGGGQLASRQVFLSVPASAFAIPAALLLQDATGFPCGPIVSGGVDAGFTIAVSPAQEPTKPVLLTVTFAPSDLAGGASAALLTLERFDAATGVCLPLATTVDAVARTLTAETNHLSTFQIVQAAAPPATLAAPRVYPNPLYPSRGQGYFTFRDVPGGSLIRVFTLRGEQVAEVQANDAGLAAWDAKNEHGSPVASGVYLAVLDSGSDRKVIKLAVER